MEGRRRGGGEIEGKTDFFLIPLSLFSGLALILSFQSSVVFLQYSQITSS